MNNRSLLICIFIFLTKHNFCMETSSRESAHIDHLLSIIEAETTYPNPNAPDRIDAAGSQLVTFSRMVIAQKWSQSCAHSNATKLVNNSKKVMDQKWGSDLHISGQMLFTQASQIYLAISLLDEKIKLLK